MRKFSRTPRAFVATVAGLVIAAPILGVTLTCQHAKLTPPRNTAPASKIAGIGINCHAEKLPIADLKAIGVQWVRLDQPAKDNTYPMIKPLVDYYHDFGQLWVLPQTVTDVAGVAKTMKRAGITDIEVFNEPDLEKMPPREYVERFNQIRGAVGDSVRLYGPAMCNWVIYHQFLDQVIALGFRPDAITFHGYRQGTEAALATWVNQARSYGLPVVVSELGYPNYLGVVPYRVKMKDSLGTLFVKTKNVLKGTPWCWYDGPNPAGDYDCGLFDDHHDGIYHPNKNYWSIRFALDKEGHH